MDKINLLEKLKSLKQWQLEQKLDFESLRSEHYYNIEGSHCPSSYHTVNEQTYFQENKENLSTEKNSSYCHEETGIKRTQRNFIDTLPNNILAQALKQANISSDDDISSTTSQMYNDVNSMIHRTLDNDANTEQLDFNFDNKPEFSNYMQPSLSGENRDLSNWHMSGLNTVIFRQDNGDTITPIKSSHENVQNYQEYSESEDGFSDVEQLKEIYGIHPISETDDENVDYDRHVAAYSDEEGHVEEIENQNSNSQDDHFFDENENTVIQMNLFEEEKLEEGPIKQENKSFQELVENELQKEKQQPPKTSAPPVSSTPIKPKKRTFLKRGEGLKRFECGNYSKDRKFVNNKTSGSEQSRSTEKPATSAKTSKGAKKNSTKRNVLPSNDRKNVLSVITEGKESKNLVMKIINERKAAEENKLKMVVPEDNRTVKFENIIRREMLDDFSINATSFDASFQNMLMQYEEKEERENQELDAFEALEEAAENLSLSSNSSVVIKYLGTRPNDEDYNYNQSTSKDEVPELPETMVVKQHFDDETSWSDASVISTGSDDNENNDTVLPDAQSSSVEKQEEYCGAKEEDISPQPKRIVSKRKQKIVFSNEDDASVTTAQESQEAIEVNMTDESDEKLPLDLIYSSNNISNAVKQKVAELEKEIEKFRVENNKLSELRVQREKDVKHLRKEIENFQKEKNEKLQRIEEFRNEEMKKIKNEKKVFDKYQKEIKLLPNKQEREELKEIKAEVTKLKEELKGKETKLTSATRRFRSRVEELEEENKELREEVNILEKQRLQRWKISDTSKTETQSKNKNSQITNGYRSEAAQKIDLKSPGPSSVSSSEPVGFSDEVWKKDDKMSFDEYYLSGTVANKNCKENKREEIRHPDGKVEVILHDMSRLITFPNGTKKTISKDEKTITVEFFNGDIKKILPNNKLVYYYSESRTTHTTFPDGQEMLEFPNNQVEKRYPDGKTEVIFPDHTVKYIYTDGSEETIFADGTVQKVNPHGERTITFANGQREIHTREYKRREYPNGTVKTVYEDGRQETKYSTGRLRVKDRGGNLIVDSGPK